MEYCHPAKQLLAGSLCLAVAPPLSLSLSLSVSLALALAVAVDSCSLAVEFRLFLSLCSLSLSLSLPFSLSFSFSLSLSLSLSLSISPFLSPFLSRSLSLSLSLALSLSLSLSFSLSFSALSISVSASVATHKFPSLPFLFSLCLLLIKYPLNPPLCLPRTLRHKLQNCFLRFTHCSPAVRRILDAKTTSSAHSFIDSCNGFKVELRGPQNTSAQLLHAGMTSLTSWLMRAKKAPWSTFAVGQTWKESAERYLKVATGPGHQKASRTVASRCCSDVSALVRLRKKSPCCESNPGDRR